MKYTFAFLLAAHGLIHLMGFIKAFGYASISQLTKTISKPVGICWSTAGLLIIAAAILYILKNDYWWLIALVGTFLSQLLIMFYWQDAKFGTLANIIILLIVTPSVAAWRFEHQYKKDVDENLSYTNNHDEPVLTTEEISILPEPVKCYIIYSGALNKPIPKNFFIKFKGQIRGDEKSEWMPFTTEQYNFIEKPVRLFYMKAIMKKLPVDGYHAYKNGIATMDIRLLSLFTVQYQSGKEMNIAETVTWFNDLCLYAPGALVDKRISWQPLDSLSSKAIFTFQDISISATLHFNTQGELINFTSDDRVRFVNKDNFQSVRFSTPVKDYIIINENKVPSYGEAVWSLPEGDLIYGQFHCQDVKYNVKSQ